MGDLFGSKALEVAITLSLFFLISSLVCSAARELIEAVLKTRASDLERALREMLADPDGAGSVKDLFSHPIIASLFPGDYDPATAGRKAPGGVRKWLHLPPKSNLPSYIPSGQFASALVDLITRGASEAPYAPPRPGGEVDVARLRIDGAAAANPAIRTLTQVVTDGVATLDEAKLRIEAWFNGSMDRASGWYKRRTYWILFMAGLVVAVVLNMDTINIARRAFDDGALRTAAVTAAEARTRGAANATAAPPERSDETIVALRQQLYDIGFPIGWTVRSGVLWPSAQSQICPRTGTGARCGHVEAGYFSADLDPDRVAIASIGSLLLMIPGWLITALGVTLGAPFWFDVLSKFVVVRSTIKPSQKSRDEASPERTQNSSPPGGDMVPGDVADVARRAAITTAAASPAAAPHETIVIERWAIGQDPDEGVL